VAAAAAFAIGFLLPPLLAATTYRLEFVTSLGWSATVTSGPTPFKEVATTLGWLASVFSGPTPFVQYLTPLGWSALVEIIPQPLKEVVTPLGWSALVEIIPQPLKEAVTGMGFSVSVSSGPTPFFHQPATIIDRVSFYGAVNVTKQDQFGFLRANEWWATSDLRLFGDRLHGVVYVDVVDPGSPYKLGVSCRSPPCKVQVFLPFGVSSVDVNLTSGTAFYSLEGVGNGTLATITLDEPSGSPLSATIKWLGEYRLNVTDYKGGSRAAELRVVYAGGDEAVLTPGASVLPVYPVVNMSWSPAGRLAFDPGNTRCRFFISTDPPTTLLAPLTAVNRCELGMLYVLGSSLEGVSASPQIGGLYRVNGRLVDEEGSPVPGRRVFVLLQGNTTRPAEAVTGPDGRFSALVYVPPSNRTRLLTVRFPGEPALMPSSKVLEIPGAGAGAAPTAEVPGSVYAFLGVMIAAFAAVVVLSFAGASRRAQAVYRSRRVLR
jgi:hypothetical protein